MIVVQCYIYTINNEAKFIISNTKYFKIRRSFLYKYDVEEKKKFLELGVLNKRALNIHVLLISRKSVRLSFTYDTWQ